MGLTRIICLGPRHILYRRLPQRRVTKFQTSRHMVWMPPASAKNLLIVSLKIIRKFFTPDAHQPAPLSDMDRLLEAAGMALPDDGWNHLWSLLLARSQTHVLPQATPAAKENVVQAIKMPCSSASPASATFRPFSAAVSRYMTMGQTSYPQASTGIHYPFTRRYHRHGRYTTGP